MTDIVGLKNATLARSRFGDDVEYLRWCAEWHVVRAKHQAERAEREGASLWGCLPDGHLRPIDLCLLDRMDELQSRLAAAQPTTLLLAQQMLSIAVTILTQAQLDSESRLAKGPVVELVQNVVRALDYRNGVVKIGRPPD